MPVRVTRAVRYVKERRTESGLMFSQSTRTEPSWCDAIVPPFWLYYGGTAGEPRAEIAMADADDGGGLHVQTASSGDWLGTVPPP